MRKSRALCTVAITAAVLLLPACASKKDVDLDQPPYAIPVAEEEGLTPEEYKRSLGAARMEKFVAMYRLLGQSEVRVHDLEVQLGIVAPDRVKVSVMEPGFEEGISGEPGLYEEPGMGPVGMAPEPIAGGLTTVVLPDDQELVLTALRDELMAERAKRDELQMELDRLRTESSAGPFERGQDVALQRAEEEIGALQSALRQEGRSRDELKRRYDKLRSQLESRGSEAVAVAENAVLREQISELKLAQQAEAERLKGELTASKKREEQLKAALESAQSGTSGVSLAGYEVLEAENVTLRIALEDEQERSKALESKLKVAMRVSDLLFRMDSQNR